MLRSESTAQPETLSRDISPPPSKRQSRSERLADDLDTSKVSRPARRSSTLQYGEDSKYPSLAAIEAGRARIEDHLAYFANHFRASLRPSDGALISINDFESLYRRNQHSHGHHFVVHQHDHPISGVHYDLRLQCSDSSTVSWAVPYGLPGNPNSSRPIRLAIETRVHTLWNNLIEAASHSTGSLLIWDTGEYEILPWKEDVTRATDDELSASESDRAHFTELSQTERLKFCFQRRRIRLRLHGTRLPANYTISMWLSRSNDRAGQPARPVRKRRRIDPAAIKSRKIDSTDDEGEAVADCPRASREGSVNADDGAAAAAAAVASDDDEDDTIRENNAYPGAVNTIGSIHQRTWMLTLDKENAGFRKARRGPERGSWVGDWDPFFVRGREIERSIVTGRSADQVMEDASVDKFVGRKMWRPIME